MVSEKKMEYVFKLFIRANRFQHRKYYVNVNYNGQCESIVCSIHERKTYNSKIIFNIYLDKLKLADIAKITQTIEDTLDMLQEKTNIETVKVKLPINKFDWVDIEKLVRGEKNEEVY